jgi:tetratricopeptide (TPR) repeat protein
MKMRKLGLLLMVVMMAFTTMAQESAELKNAGNEALRNKDYKGALEKYEAYFATDEEGVADDDATLYNMARCAYELEDWVKAKKYYTQCVDKGYRADLALYYISQIYKKQGDEENEIETLKRILKEYPASKNFRKFQDYVALKYNKDAQEPYNKGNSIAMEAAASGDPGVYLLKMGDAIKSWEDAKVAFEKTLSVQPENSTAKAALTNITDQIKAYEDYKESLKKK